MRSFLVASLVVLFACSNTAESSAPEEAGGPPGSEGEGNPTNPGSTTTPPGTPSPSTPGDEGAVTCTRDEAFPKLLAVPEASAATEIAIGAVRHLLVVGDSKNEGAAILVPLGGDARAPKQITLPLDEVSDDVEGLATHAGAIYALTSSGAVMRFTIDAAGSIARDGDAYAIGGASYTCSDLEDHNCGKNWEGLCLRREPKDGACAGYAASKAEGALYCVNVANGKLAIDAQKKPIALGLPKSALSDCAFGKQALLVTTNDAGGSKTYVVDEAAGTKKELAVTGHGSNEAIAVTADGALFQLEDASTKESAASRWACKGL